MDECCANKGKELTALAQQADPRRVLIIVMLINLAMFFAEFAAGIVAHSASLQADAVEMLGDALVYSPGRCSSLHRSTTHRHSGRTGHLDIFIQCAGSRVR